MSNTPKKKKPPRQVMLAMRAKLFDLAEQFKWNELSDADRNIIYTNWTSDPDIGGVISRYLGAGGVKTYLKDAVIKVYSRKSRAEGYKLALAKLGLDPSAVVVKKYEKPHGVRIADGKIVCWARSKQWKAVLMALHERAFADKDAVPYGALLIEASDGYSDPAARCVVDNAAIKLGVRKVAWVE